jgi:hypothetical protein
VGKRAVDSGVIFGRKKYSLKGYLILQKHILCIYMNEQNSRGENEI